MFADCSQRRLLPGTRRVRLEEARRPVSAKRRHDDPASGLDEPLPEEPIELGDSWFVYQLISRTEADEESFDDEAQARHRDRLLVRKQREVLSAYIGQLRARADSEGAVRINQGILSYGLEPEEEEDEGESEPTAASGDDEAEG